MAESLVQILLADDSITIQKVVELTFSDGAYEVTSVSNGMAAIEAVQRVSPDIVIADIHMPGKNGYDLCRSVKQTFPDTPVLLLVGTFERHDPAEVVSCGADGLIIKPFESQALINKVDELVGNRKPVWGPTSPHSTRNKVLPLGDADSSPRRVRPESAPGPRVFLCHATEDKEMVRDLYRRFQSEGFAPWLDEEDILPGQDWRRAIAAQLRICDAVVVCLSRKSVTKTGYVQKEIADALSILAEHPEDAIFVIPLLLDDCEIPARLSHLHAARLSAREGFARVCRAIRDGSRRLRF